MVLQWQPVNGNHDISQPTEASVTNIWFGIALSLIGFIVGYLLQMSIY